MTLSELSKYMSLEFLKNPIFLCLFIIGIIGIIYEIFKFIKMFFRALYKLIDFILITPLSRAVYFIGDKFGSKNGGFDKFFNNPNTLIFISLICAFAAFLAIDRK